VKKLVISKLFLYRYRFVIGFILLSAAYLGILFGLPLLSPAGISEAEMQSAASSYAVQLDAVFRGDIINLPYRVLQKLSIMTFGLNIYAIKLPSIIIGALLGGLLILLLNRWFKTNVALFASILAVLSASFLYLAGNGTPLIMIVFWPTLLLWLGSKIQGVTKPKPMYCFVFAFALLASIFTPYMIYLAGFIVLFAFLHPHLRFTIKTLPTFPLVLTIFIIVMGLAAAVMAAFINPNIIAELLLMPDFSFQGFISNIQTAFLPFFAWNTTLDSSFLSPFIGLASVALAVIGLLSTSKGFFASRNSIAICLIIFTVFLSGFNPEAAILILLPMAILIAHGLRYILAKWYDLFPDNPYARISAVFPIGLFLGIMIMSNLTHFLYGYRYIPVVADKFQDDIKLLDTNLETGTTVYVQDENKYNFYQILDQQGKYTVVQGIPEKEELPERFAVLGHEKVPADIERIITSPKSDNSDRIYIYTRQTTEEQKEL